MKQRPAYTGPVVIVGNGGSVDRVPASFWHQPGVEYVGTNRCLALAACQTVEWSVLCMRDSYRKMFFKKDHGWQYHDQLWKPSPAWKVGSSSDRGVSCDEFVRQEPKWQLERNEDRGNHEAAVMRNSSVVLMAANFAWICGARDLRLIGVDYCPPPHGKFIPPWCDYEHAYEHQYDRPIGKGPLNQFRNMTKAIQEAGGRVVNFSPGTALDAVPLGVYT